jgi:uncharacterized membrane protein YvlD (DUF360 family)
MIITLFSFGLSWAVYAFVFYGMTLVTPAFHSTYSQEVFSVAFTIGFLEAAFLKSIRVMNFKIHPIGLFILSAALNYLLIRLTSGFGDTYYVSGHKGAILVSVVLAVTMLLFEIVKDKFFSDIRL